MSISNARLKAAIQAFDKAMKESAPFDEMMAATYADNFWERSEDATHGRTWEGTPPSHEVNHVKAFIDSMRASVTYSAVRPTVTAAPDVPIEANAADAVRQLLDQWVHSSQATDETERAYNLNLAFGNCAFKVGCNDSPSGRTVDDVWIKSIPRWDLLFDTKVTNVKDTTWFGVFEWVDKDVLRQRYPKLTNEHLTKAARRGAAEQPLNDTDDDKKEDVQYCRVLELHDWGEPVDIYDETGELVEPKPEDEDIGQDQPITTVRGEMRKLLIGKDGVVVKELFRGVSPYFVPNSDEPLRTIIPCVLLPHLKYPAIGLPIAGTIMNLNATINWHRTWLLDTASIHARQIGMVDESAIDGEHAAKQMETAKSGTLFKKKPSTEGTPTSKEPIQWFSPGPMPQSMVELAERLEYDREATTGASPTTRGEPMKYATLGEVQLAGMYSENNAGDVRRRMDRAVLEVLRAVPVLLGQALDKAGRSSITVMVGSSTVEVQRYWLDYPWVIGLEETPSTPMAEQTQSAKINNAKQLLEPAALAIDLYVMGQGGPAAAGLAVAIYDYALQTYGLPASFKLENLTLAAERARTLFGALAAPPPPPAPEPPMDQLPMDQLPMDQLPFGDVGGLAPQMGPTDVPPEFLPQPDLMSDIGVM